MRVAFNKKIVDGPWGGGNQMLLLIVNYLRKHKYEVVFSLEEKPDVVVIMDVKNASCSFAIESLSEYKRIHGCEVIHRVNDNGSHRGGSSERNDQRMIDVNLMLADRTIFISRWLQQYYEERGLYRNDAVVIPNGTDRSLFYPLDEIQHKDGDPFKIVTHHWSNNMAKGYEVYDALANFCHKNPSIAKFTFMGNRPQNLLSKANLVAPRPYKDIPSCLRSHDLYVTATQFESGGCHIIEAMGCGLVPFVKHGGGGVEEYANGFASYYNTAEDLIDLIVDLHKNYEEYLAKSKMVREGYMYGTEEMCSKYKEVIDGMVERSV